MIYDETWYKDYMDNMPKVINLPDCQWHTILPHFPLEFKIIGWRDPKFRFRIIGMDLFHYDVNVDHGYSGAQLCEYVIENLLKSYTLYERTNKRS